MTETSLGRYGETGMWIIVALFHGPRTAIGLLDAVRDLDGRIGPGRLLGAVARLERLDLIEPTPTPTGIRAYRLSTRLLSDSPSTTTI